MNWKSPPTIKYNINLIYWYKYSFLFIWGKLPCNYFFSLKMGVKAGVLAAYREAQTI